MKRADSNTHPTEQSLNAGTHFTGCLVGKRERQNLIRLNSALHQSHDAMRDDASFPGPRPGQHQQRSFKMFHRLVLRTGQTGGYCRYVNRQVGTPRSCGKPPADGSQRTVEGQFLLANGGILGDVFRILNWHWGESSRLDRMPRLTTRIFSERVD